MGRMLLTFAVAVAAVRASGDEPKSAPELAIARREVWSCFFGGRTADLHFAVDAARGFHGQAGWSLEVSGRTVARQEVAVAAEPGRTAVVAVRLPLPPVKPGIVMPARWTVELYGPDRGRAAFLQEPLWVFPEDPFVDRSVQLSRLDVRVFDPQGNTRDVLKRASVPFKEVKNLDAVHQAKGGVLVVGEGISLERHRGLPTAMVRAASAGTPVLCLAPADGAIPMPGAEGSADPKPERLCLKRSDAIRDLDKRLDAQGWPPDGKIVAASMLLGVEKSCVAARVEGSDKGWPWLEADYPSPGRRLVVCGFPLIEKWEAGPVPRFLMARLLDHVTAKTHPSPEKEDTHEQSK